MSRDGWIGLGLLLFSGWLYTHLDDIPANPLVPVGPSFYPRCLLLLTIGLSLALVLQQLLTARAEKDQASRARRVESYRPTLVAFSGFFLYVLLLPKLGYFFSTALFVSSLQWVLGRPRWRRLPGSLLLGTGTALITYTVFERYLHVFLPRGSWLP
ncbi:MAG TPA: tripartite tricarboxylate transporter TctB family protein [Candidatus Eisenbacteria bacterium]|nr:tripartite tricarboxylate transporter TctB family protein [Candidatus Eisenbacteria bacterium]